MNIKNQESKRYVASRWVNGKKYYRESRISKADAEAKLNSLLSCLDQEKEIRNVRDAFEMFIFPRWENVSRGSRSKYYSNWKYIDMYIGDCPLHLLTVKVAQDFVTALQRTTVTRNGKKGTETLMAPKTVNHIFGLVVSSMKILTLHQVIPFNPFDRMVVSLPQQPPKIERFMDLEDALAMLNAIPDDFVLVVWLGMVLGLREGEISGLQWSSISRRTREIRISQQRTKWTELTPTKGRKMRVLKVPQSFIDFIDRHGDLDSEYVCTNSNGNPYRNDKIYKRWMSLKCRPDGWTFHDLRHLSAGLLTYLTGDPRTAKTVLGHSNIDTTALYIAEEATRAEKGFDKLTALTNR